MKTYKNINFPLERALYAEKNIKLHGCSFSGAEDGESALKETKNVEAKKCRFELRYPLWHTKGAEIIDCVMTNTCRAALWYSSDIKITKSTLSGIKAVRECDRVSIEDSFVSSPEFGWKSKNIEVKNTEISGEYPFFLSQNLRFYDVKLNGKYSFQYIENGVFENCIFETKDAFWHAKNVTVKNSVIKGEYFSWYSENLTLINCKIIGTQPLCYCKGLRLIGCKLEDADFAFEYSEVEADIKGDIISVKNPLSGKITADSIGEIILTDDSVYKPECKIEKRQQRGETIL